MEQLKIKSQIYYQYFMQKNNKKLNVNTSTAQPKCIKSHAFLTNQDFFMIETLSLLIQPILITKNEDIYVKPAHKGKVDSSNYATDRKVTTTKLIQQFSSQSDTYSNIYRKKEPASSFAQHIKQKRCETKNIKTNSSFNQQQNIKSGRQSKKQSPSKYYSKTIQITKTTKQNEQNTGTAHKQQNSLRQSTMTFSPLRIDISLPSLDSQDLDQVFQQRQMINQIEKDIKHLIHKIKQNHYEESPYKKQKKSKY